MPQFGTLPFLSKLNVCKTLDNFERAHYFLREALKSARDKCKTPCKLLTYRRTTGEESLPGTPKNTSQLKLFFYNTNVMVEGTYVLFDINSIVASVGGSLGLFLGFSFWDWATLVIDKMVGLKNRFWPW